MRGRSVETSLTEQVLQLLQVCSFSRHAEFENLLLQLACY
jgi:hypothetical protein